MFNLKFDYHTDTPGTKDPDGYSPSLNRHHKFLWEKPLPNGQLFHLNCVKVSGKHLLVHNSELGEFVLASDMITHTFFGSSRDRKSFSGKVSYGSKFPNKAIKNEISDVIKDFWSFDVGIGCYTLFPAKKINRQNTINQERGTNSKICDRFDLTLECIRRFYGKSKDINPLIEVLERNNSFFALFGDFKGYVDFFHFEDLVERDYQQVKFWLPFAEFSRSPLPQNSHEYQNYKTGVCRFISSRRERIQNSLVSRR